MQDQLISEDESLQTKALEGVLIGVIFVGSLVLWIGLPFVWIWTASQFVSQYPAVYALAIVGCPATMVLWGWALHRINAVYMGVRPDEGPEPGNRREAWLKSLGAERVARRRSLTVLEVSSITSVVIALAAIAIWFFFFAEMHLAPL